jgi:protein SCO1/2
MRIAIGLLVLGLFAGTESTAQQRHEARGVVLALDKAHDSVVISCRQISGFMDAMTMSFAVRDPKQLDGLAMGDMVEFSLVVDGGSSYIDAIRVHHYKSMEQDPSAARRLKLMADMADPKAASQRIKVGDHVPDFSLTDQNGRRVALSQFSGKIVGLTFSYTHCALPNFCFRISNNFRALQKRFRAEMGRDLILMTITFDPVHDTPDVMAKYGKTWNADPESWRLLTGSAAQVQELCNRFGMSAWFEEGLMTHSLHTFLINSHGVLAADLEGNEFSSDQLGDLVETMLAQAQARSLSDVSR